MGNKLIIVLPAQTKIVFIFLIPGYKVGVDGTFNVSNDDFNQSYNKNYLISLIDYEGNSVDCSPVQDIHLYKESDCSNQEGLRIEITTDGTDGYEMAFSSVAAFSYCDC